MKQSSLLLLLLILSTSAFSQKQVFTDEVKRESYINSFGQSGPNQAILDHMLSKIADGMNQTNYQTSFMFSLDMRKRLTRIGSNQLEIFATLENPMISGNFRYRGFDISDVMLPDQMNMRVVVKNTKGKKVFERVMLNIDIKNPPATLVQLTVVDTSKVKRDLKLELEDKSYRYSKYCQNEFDQRTLAVDSYYASEKKLEEIHTGIHSIQLSNLDYLFVEEERMKQFLRELQGIRDAGFIELLKRDPSNDIQKIIPRLEEVEREAQDVHHDLDHAISILPMLYLDRGLANLQVNNEDGAMMDFLKSIDLNPAFAPAHFQLAILDYEHNMLSEAAARVSDVLQRMNPDINTRNACIELALTIYHDYLNEGIALSRDGNFESALRELNEAGKLCTYLIEVKCTPELAQTTKLAISGIYFRLINYARDAISNDRLEDAEESLHKAIRYQGQNQDVIEDANEANKLMLEVRRKQYVSKIEKGKIELQSQRFEQALTYFEEARALELNHDFQRDPNLVLYILNAAKPVILDEIQSGIEFAKQNNLGAARKIYRDINEMAKHYGMLEEEEVIQAKAELTQAIFAQECENASADYDAEMQKAENAAGIMDFLGADAIYNIAIRIANNHKECEMTYETAIAKKKDIFVAVSYQHNLKGAEDLIGKGNYSQGISSYDDAKRYFDLEDVESFGLQHQELFIFIYQHRNRNFQAFGIKYFMDQNELQHSLGLTKKLVLKGFPPKALKAEMIELGYKMAEKDHKRTPEADPKSRVTELIEGSRNMKYFKKSYLKHWKKL